MRDGRSGGVRPRCEIALDGGESGRWRVHGLDGTLHPGHRIQILADSHLAWQRLMEDLNAARVSILIALYMLVDDSVGQAFVATLAAAAERGVLVRLELNGLGALDEKGRLTGRLDAAALRWPPSRQVRRPATSNCRAGVAGTSHCGHPMTTMVSTPTCPKAT